MSEKPMTQFEQAASQKKGPSLARELWHFLKTNKKWWLLPLILVLLVFGLFVLVSGSAIAPFIYTIF